MTTQMKKEHQRHLLLIDSVGLQCLYQNGPLIYGGNYIKKTMPYVRLPMGIYVKDKESKFKIPLKEKYYNDNMNVVENI